MARSLLRGSPQSFRRRLPEQRAVGNRKAPQLPKAVVGNDPRDSCLGPIGTEQRPPHEVHSAQGEITDWPHAEMLFAGGAKRSLRDADRGANLGEIKRPVGICLQEFLKPRDDGVVTTAAGGRLYSGAFGKAPHHHMNELILKRPKHLRQLQNIRAVVGKLPDALVQF